MTILRLQKSLGVLEVIRFSLHLSITGRDDNKWSWTRPRSVLYVLLHKLILYTTWLSGYLSQSRPYSEFIGHYRHSTCSASRTTRQYVTSSVCLVYMTRGTNSSPFIHSYAHYKTRVKGTIRTVRPTAAAPTASTVHKEISLPWIGSKFGRWRSRSGRGQVYKVMSVHAVCVVIFDITHQQ